MTTQGLQMKYFVLKPKGEGPYAKASRAAMRQYARLIRQENPDLHDELLEWADKEMFEVREKDIAP